MLKYKNIFVDNIFSVCAGSVWCNGVFNYFSDSSDTRLEETPSTNELDISHCSVRKLTYLKLEEALRYKLI